MGGGPAIEDDDWEVLPPATGAGAGSYADPTPWRSTVSFTLNGAVFTLANPDPLMSLGTFIRDVANLRGTKISCGQGGCGACVVYAVSQQQSGSPGAAAPTMGSINSCLRSVAACDGLAILTVEGIGNRKAGFHPVQSRLAAGWGSQCGFCSPGMVMSLYSMLQKNPKGCDPSEIEFAGELDGNICRCTGYRPIIEVGQSFSNAPPKPAAVGGSCPGICGKRADPGDGSPSCPGVCGKPGAPLRDIESLAEQFPYDPRQHDVDVGAHLSKLREALGGDADAAALAPIKVSGGDGKVTYYRPVTLAQAQQVASSLASATPPVAFRFIRGNTSTGVYAEELSGCPNLIDLTSVTELLAVSADPSSASATFGSSVPIEVLFDTFKALAGNATLAAAGAGVFPELLGYIGRVAHTHVRNAGSWAGNLMMAKRFGFASDLATILEALGATVELQVGGQAAQPAVAIGDFFSMQDDPSLLVLSLTVPYPKSGDLLVTDKCALRPQNSHSLLNAAMYVTGVTQGAKALGDARVVFGAVDKSPVRAKATEAALSGQPLNQATLTAALAASAKEAVPAAMPEFETLDQPQGKVAYRTSLVSSFVYRFLARAAIATGAADPSTSPSASAASVIKRSPMTATTAYSPVDPGFAPVTQALPKLTAVAQTSGEARYIADMAAGASADDCSVVAVGPGGGKIPSPPGASGGGRTLSSGSHLHAAFVLSPFPTGPFAIDAGSIAAEVRGFVALLTAADVPGSNNSDYGNTPLFADGSVLYAGQPVGMIVATSQDLADRIAASVKVVRPTSKIGPGQVSYERIAPDATATAAADAVPTPVLTINDAIAQSRFFPLPAMPGLSIASGDVDAAISSAQYVSKATVVTGGQKHFYMEHQACLAVPDEMGRFVLHASTQMPNDVAIGVAGALGVKPMDVTVTTRRLGGGYGGKLSRSFPAACATAVAASVLGTPVSMYMSTDCDFRYTGGRNPVQADVTVAYDDSGVITGLKVDSYLNGGATLDASLGVALEYNQALDSCYFFPNASLDVKVCHTDLPTKTAIRSFGHIQSAMVTESIIEIVAEALSMDPTAVRTANMYTDRNCITPYGQPILDFTAPDIWQRLMSSSQYPQRHAAIQAFNAASKWKKKGITMVPVKYGISWETATATVAVNAADGSVVVHHGGVEMGNGINVKVAQAVAMVLGAPMELIRVGPANTDAIPNIQATGGSAGSGSNSEAARLAALDLMSNLAPVIEGLERAAAKGSPRPTWNDIVNAAGGTSVNLFGRGYFQAGPGRGGVGVGIDGAWNSTGKQYYTFGAGCVEVELDVLTGDVQVLQCDILYDAGRSMNPAVDIGQIEGAFIMGLGYFLTEEVGTAATGELLTTGTWTYKPPTVGMVPEKFNVTLYDGERGGFARGVLTSKGVGEPPLITSRAVFGAVRSAILAARADMGVTATLPHFSPMTIDRRQQDCGVSVAALKL